MFLADLRWGSGCVQGVHPGFVMCVYVTMKVKTTQTLKRDHIEEPASEIPPKSKQSNWVLFTDDSPHFIERNN